MKKQKFSWLPLLIFTGYVGLYLLSCQRDTAQLDDPKPLSNDQVFSRTCDCTCTISTDDDTTLDFCGDLPQATSNCTGCNSNGNDRGATGALFYKDEPKEICLTAPGSICIKNAGLNSVTVTVYFGGSTPIVIAIGANQTQCFYTTNDCDTTESHCL